MAGEPGLSPRLLLGEEIPRQIRPQVLASVAAEHPRMGWDFLVANRTTMEGLLDPLQRLATVNIQFQEAFIAVDRGRLTVISVQRYAPEYGNTDDAAWPCRVEMEWPAKPNRVATSSGWGLRWIEWANDDVPGADSVLRVARMSDFSITNPTLDPPMQPLHALQSESIVELRASWPFPCLAWSDSAAVLAAQSTVPTPSPRHVWMCRGWAAPTSPLATYLGYSGTVPRFMPLAPRPFAFALNSTIWAAAFFAMASAIRWGLPPARRARRRRFNLCEHCAYPRDTFARCPECGARAHLHGTDAPDRPCGAVRPRAAERSSGLHVTEVLRGAEAVHEPLRRSGHARRARRNLPGARAHPPHGSR